MTALALLTSALTRLGVNVKARGYTLTTWPDTGNPVSPGLLPIQAIVLAHNPADHDRLWWWLLQPRSTGQPSDLQPCGPATDICATAQSISTASSPHWDRDQEGDRPPSRIRIRTQRGSG
jgi:hypothetical protein